MNALRYYKTNLLPSAFAVVAFAALLAAAAPASSATTFAFHATFVEPVGGPNNSAFECPAGTSCGTANLSQLGHGSSIVYFFACGIGCQLRIVTLDDGAQIVMNEYGNLESFYSPGNSGADGYNGFGLPGNPQFLDITQTIIGGTGRFANVSGSAAGTVRVQGGVAVITTTGTISVP
jgi:hypothetical protein